MSGLADMSGIWDLGPVWTDPQSKIYYSYHHSRLIEVYTNLSQTVSYNRHHLHWKIEGNGPRGPQTPGWWLRNTQISRKSLAVWFLAVKCPLFLIEYLLDGQLPHVLWHWHVSILSQKKYIYIYTHTYWREQWWCDPTNEPCQRRQRCSILLNFFLFSNVHRNILKI